MKLKMASLNCRNRNLEGKKKDVMLTYFSAQPVHSGPVFFCAFCSRYFFILLTQYFCLYHTSHTIAFSHFWFAFCSVLSSKMKQKKSLTYLYFQAHCPPCLSVDVLWSFSLIWWKRSLFLCFPCAYLGRSQHTGLTLSFCISACGF